MSLEYKLITICISDKDVVILVTDTLGRGNGTVGPIQLINPHKPGLQSRAIYDALCFINS